MLLNFRRHYSPPAKTKLNNVGCWVFFFAKWLLNLLEQQVAALEDKPAGKIRPKLILRLVLLPIPTIAQKSTF
jgi:hypothetical protein